MSQNKTYTIQDIIDLSVEDGMGGRRTSIEVNNFKISIVGGRQGLYGDFVEDFEVAIMTKENSQFVTKLFFHAEDDVLPYQSGKDVEEIVKIVMNQEFPSS